MFPWHWEPIPLLELLALEIAYLLLIGPLRGRIAGSAPVRRGMIWCFSLGVLTAALAVVTPLEAVSERFLFSGHMIQHMLLTLVVPPLLLAGTPAWLVDQALRWRPVERLAYMLTRPLPALLIFNLIFISWHDPELYDFTLRNKPVHIASHLLFMGSALLTWWPVLSPTSRLPRATYPVQIIYLFVESIPPTILGAIITFAAEPIYPTYAAAPRLWGISALDDQQVAGLMMWILGALAFFGALTVVWFTWIKDQEQQDAPWYQENVEGRSVASSK